jgi:hypothetical protein
MKTIRPRYLKAYFDITDSHDHSGFGRRGFREIERLISRVLASRPWSVFSPCDRSTPKERRREEKSKPVALFVRARIIHPATLWQQRNQN